MIHTSTEFYYDDDEPIYASAEIYYTEYRPETPCWHHTYLTTQMTEDLSLISSIQTGA